MEAKVVQSEEELKKAFDIRVAVFVDEQKVPAEEEIDEFEDKSTHFLLYDGEKAVGAGRLRVVDGVGKVERICVLSTHRKGGSGKLIMNKIEEAAKEKGLTKLKLHGQTHAEGFYQKLGYETISDVFIEAGIPHITMIKEIKSAH
ncbi:GNAT family N-acetyltransferase [Bacillus taeanensis]|uniref:GNAT family N-acetyltransferase n=1 Tax=Bacillus taeanensis TaxID=273032 RepID=A0A366Y2T9_9BACI|nr:GNAT family N-acetyltransferase [Bacillus taeanensis]RBW70723.1 GNAT family N-acetyltransferase [Bacillus taeanensis]